MTKPLALSQSVPVPITVSLQRGGGGLLLWLSTILIHPPPPPHQQVGAKILLPSAVHLEERLTVSQSVP